MTSEVDRAGFQTLRRSDGPALAYHLTDGRGPIVVWLSGFGSDMAGAKAVALEGFLRAAGRGYLRFDYSGHGLSHGRFEDGAIGIWRDDALAAIDALSDGPIVLVGSSMGGWLALLAALARPRRVAGLVLLAPAPDFTERLVWQNLSFSARREIMERGFCEQLSLYTDTPTRYTRKLIEDGRNWLLLDAPIPFEGPVRILHGQADPDVPWRQSLLLTERLASANVSATFVKDGDHRLSRPQDIALLCETLAGLLNAL